jgi:hypothetical protein
MRFDTSNNAFDTDVGDNLDHIALEMASLGASSPSFGSRAYGHDSTDAIDVDATSARSRVLSHGSVFSADDEAALAASMGATTCTAIPPDQLQVSQRRLGLGAFSKVLAGEWAFSTTRPPLSVAVKVFESQGNEVFDPAAARAILQEAFIGASVQHSNLVRTFGFSFVAGSLRLVLELCDGGNLATALAETPPSSWVARARWLEHVAAGMSALHSHKPRPILHRDLKSANVLLTADRSTAKVGDFGLSKVDATMATGRVTGGVNGSMAGTAGFKAPETYVVAPCTFYSQVTR